MNYNIKKIVLFSDIHFGKKANSQQHNQDCIDFINWCKSFIEQHDVDAIGFLGDWNENRSALNIQTLNYSYQAAKILNELNIPIFFVIGNHDLYHRHTREIHSIVPFSEFTNFIIIEEPMVINNDSGDDILFCPYLFHEEYPSLIKYINIPVWMGHFEFKGFEVTGYGMKMPTGPDPEDFKGPEYILSGHFHKRQAKENSNVVYIGNTFPMDFGDAGDVNRGLTVYDTSTKQLEFYNWDDCPKYSKTKLSNLLDNSVKLFPNSRVKCLVDIPISFEESTYLRQKYTEDYNLREFTLEESSEIKEALSETEIDVSLDNKLASVDELVQEMLKGIESEHIKNQTLIEIYANLPSKK